MNKKELKRFNELYQRHLGLLKLKGKAQKTIKAYSCAVRRVSKHFDCCPDKLYFFSEHIFPVLILIKTYLFVGIFSIMIYFVLQELFSYGIDTVVSWSGRTSEIEFILEIDGKIIPVEVKAGINTKAKSLIAC